ncbi:MAG: hypothetical protein R3E82_18570 [Pseudomonadales bacterium]
MKFPSIQWFEAIQQEAKAEADTFRRMGFCDAKVLFESRSSKTNRRFLLSFEDYGMTSVRELGTDEKADADFSLTADETVWQEMIENIHSNGEADLGHTLNRLQLPGAVQLVAEDQQRADLFYRYNQTFQEFFNLSSRVESEFAGSA